MKTEIVTTVAKSTVVGGGSTSLIMLIMGSDMLSYIVGMLFAYIYAMNSKDFKFSIKEDIPVIGIGTVLIYFISSAMPKIIGSLEVLKSTEIVGEMSNIVGVIIGTVMLLVVKYWLTIREEVVHDKIDNIVSKKEWK